MVLPRRGNKNRDGKLLFSLSFKHTIFSVCLLFLFVVAKFQMNQIGFHINLML